MTTPHTRTQNHSALLGGGRFRAFLRRIRGSTPPAPRAASASPLHEILLPAARTRWMLPSVRDLTPAKIEGILREALVGRSPRQEQELYTLMETTWPRLAKNTQELKNAVVGLEWNVMHPHGDKDLAAEEIINRARLGMRGDPTRDLLGWEGTLRHLLNAWFRGVAILEIDWRAGADEALPGNTRVVPPWHYGWRLGPTGGHPASDDAQQRDGRLVLYTAAGRVDTATDIPPDKFLVGLRNISGGHPSGGALLRALAGHWVAANFAGEWLLNFAQLFGIPFRYGKYRRGDMGARDELVAVLEKMGSAPWAVGPEGTALEYHEASKTGADNPQSAILDRADRACDILILGQTLTTDTSESGGSRAMGEVHRSIRSDIVDSAASWLAEILNEQLIPALLRLNRGSDPDLSALPWWEPSAKQAPDTKILAETIEILVRAGLPIPRAWAYTSLDIPEPKAGEAVLEAPATDDPYGGMAPPRLRSLLSRMPVDTRAYVLDHLRRP